MNWPCPHIQYLATKKHQCSCSVLFVDCSEAPLALLVFAGAFSCSLHCKALQGLLILLPSLQRQPGIDRIMGLNDSLGRLSEEGCWLQKHIQWRWVNSQALAFPLLFLAFVLFVSDKKWMPSYFLFPVQWIVSPPQESSALITLANLLKLQESSLCVSDILYEYKWKDLVMRNKTFCPKYPFRFDLIQIQGWSETSATKAQVLVCVLLCVCVCVLLLVSLFYWWVTDSSVQ